jgi:site-specific DNA-methyltransferase (adenine-specific)
MIELNKIYCGDCLDLMGEMEEKSVDLLLTDPPYFVPVNYYVHPRGEATPKRTLSDISILQSYFKFILAEVNRILKPTATMYIFCDAQSYPIFYQAMFPYNKHVRLIIWDKQISYNGYTWRHQHELIAWGERDETVRIPTGDGDIIKCRGVLQEDRNHPAEKPIELLEKLLLKSTKEMDVVFDPFCGSGSSMVSAKKHNRKFIGIEINEDYVAIANKRIAGESNTKLEQWFPIAEEAT